jgi:DNA mismatch endonuclease (patch repair protein)
VKTLPGKPDLVFHKYKTVIQVHGCFWHSHDCKYGRVIPKTNTEKWQLKRRGNVERDQKNIRALENLGWKVVVIWECETRASHKLDSRIKNIFAIQV